MGQTASSAVTAALTIGRKRLSVTLTIELGPGFRNVAVALACAGGIAALKALVRPARPPAGFSHAFARASSAGVAGVDGRGLLLAIAHSARAPGVASSPSASWRTQRQQICKHCCTPASRPMWRSRPARSGRVLAPLVAVMAKRERHGFWWPAERRRSTGWPCCVSGLAWPWRGMCQARRPRSHELSALASNASVGTRRVLMQRRSAGKRRPFDTEEPCLVIALPGRGSRDPPLARWRGRSLSRRAVRSAA
jgi:hypothetical protein